MADEEHAPRAEAQADDVAVRAGAVGEEGESVAAKLRQVPGEPVTFRPGGQGSGRHYDTSERTGSDRRHLAANLFEQVAGPVLVAPVVHVLPVKARALNRKDVANIVNVLAALSEPRPAELGDDYILRGG